MPDRVWMLESVGGPRWFRSPRALATAVLDENIRPGDVLVEYRLRGSASARSSEPLDLVAALTTFMATRPSPEVKWPVPKDLAHPTAVELAERDRVMRAEAEWRRRMHALLVEFITRSE